MLPIERLRGIEAFVQAAATGSFTAAGKRLNLTNSAIGKSVGRLEMRLGRKLFERSTRRLELTDAGAAFYATCVRVLADLADAEAVLAAHESEPVGRLRINLPVALGHLQGTRLILDLVERHPKLTPELVFTDRFVDLVDERVDVAVRLTPSQEWPASLGRQYLGTERLIFCAAPSVLEREGCPRSIDDLLKTGAVLYGRSDGSTTPWRIAHSDGLVEARPVQARIILGSAEAQVRAVQAGLGYAQLATWLIRDELDKGELVQVLPEMETDGLPAHLIWMRNRELSPKLNVVIKAFAAGLQIS
ncbi:LysR family transcriptional regulator [Neorhizobium sp. NPDC001467]|uniref:LysR family transcriptional regulator n=1 Tax=Neorhizobium sp. NPDC001467 TaxID=3390595 RepID=UPI003D040520